MIDKGALHRLRIWSDPKASGNPSERLRKIWRSPKEMARDIHVLLEAIDRLPANRN